MKDHVLVSAFEVRQFLVTLKSLWEAEDLTEAERARVLDVRDRLTQSKPARKTRVRIHASVLRDLVDVLVDHFWRNRGRNALSSFRGEAH